MKTAFYLKYILLALCLGSGVISTLTGNIKILLITFVLVCGTYLYFDYMGEKIRKWEGGKKDEL